MNSKNVKKQSAKALANVSLKLGKCQRKVRAAISSTSLKCRKH